MEDERINQIKDNTEIIEQSNETLERVMRTIKIMDDMVGDK